MTDKIVSNFNVSPKTEFEKGINLNFELDAGETVKERLSNAPEYFNTNPATYSFELLIEDSGKGSEVITALENVKDMFLGMIPPLQEAIEKGVTIYFRHVGLSVFIDVSLDKEFGEMVKAQMSLLTLDLSQIKEHGEFHLTSGIKLNAPLDTTYEDFVKMASNLSAIGAGEYGLNKLFDSVLTAVKNLGSMGEKIEKFVKAARILTAFKKLNFEVKYDSNELATYIKELAGKIVHNTQGGASMDELNSELGTQIISSMASQFQEMGKSQLEGVKQMIGMFIDPYRDQLNLVNFDSLSMTVTSPNYLTQIKLNLSLVGITEFLRSNILN